MTVYRWKNKSGQFRYYYQFYKNGTAYRGGGYGSRKEAVDEESKQRTELTHPQKITFGQLVDKYLEHIRTYGQTESWVHEKKNLIDRWWKIWFPLPVSKITTNLIEQHLKSRLGITAGTINRDRTVLLAIFNFACRQGFTNTNPVIKIPKRPESQPPRYVPPLSDFKKVLELADGIDRLLLLALVLTGARIGEVLNLRWDDIGETTVTLKSRKHKGGEMRARQIPIPQMLTDALLQLRNGTQWVFANNKTSNRYRYRPKMLSTLCQRAGVKRFTYHAIRALSATVLSSCGIPLRDIQQLLGHASLTTTEIYLRSIRLVETSQVLASQVLPPMLPVLAPVNNEV